MRPKPKATVVTWKSPLPSRAAAAAARKRLADRRLLAAAARAPGLRAWLIAAAMRVRLATRTTVVPAGLAFVAYGNYCGPGHGGGVPVDALDSACMRHDLAYR